MRLHKLFWIIALLTFIVSISACAATNSDPQPLEAEPTEIPTEEATAVPTKVEPTPNATATAVVVAYVATVDAQRSADVPPLPFDDNPDPLQCGIPESWRADSEAWLNGYYEGELVRPTVFLYDSHLRLNIEAQAPHGSEVEVLLYQQNPVTDYYLVKITGLDGPNEGWVPAPFLSFEALES